MTVLRRMGLWLAGIALLIGTALPAQAAEGGGRDTDWPHPLGGDHAWRYSALTQINRQTVKHLRPVWSFSTGVLRGHEGGPLVVGDTMYVHTPFPNRLFALDLNDDGRIRWSYTPVQDPAVIGIMCCDTVNRGPAYADGRLFLHLADTSLVALDARTGKELWKIRDGDPAKGETGTSAPLVAGDLVLVGNSGGEFGVRGHMTAYAVKDGHRVWRAYAVGPDSDTLMDPLHTTQMGQPVGANSSLSSWSGDAWKLGGGPSWGWISYDPALDLIYYGTGNPGVWNPLQRPGDNRWAMSVFARDRKTGIAKWVYQFTPHDAWDYDGINEMILADIPVNGRQTKALVHFDRNGFAYVLDRVSGMLLQAKPFDPSLNWAKEIDLSTGKPVRNPRYEPKEEDKATKGICPSSLGAKNEQPAAFSPQAGLFLVPVNRICMDEEPFRVSYQAGQPYVGANLTLYPPPNLPPNPPRGTKDLGAFIGYEAGQGRIVWTDAEPFSVWSGALATAGGVAFYGTLEGWLKAVNVKDGSLLWQYKTPSGIIGNVMTYRHHGRQYVAVLSGVGGWAGIGLAEGLGAEDSEGTGAAVLNRALNNYTRLGGVLTVFGLP
ncbi:PQQ-dependent dehydrogenase, methanol/ethanol family [Granulibacter bethesdensis]|uniref:PQQ-dependent dehydrogenase, methanol/ethanol family n=1 Tax=Granulibacter bethesdensis TaxID=364410 RepID=UPI002FC63B87